MIFDVSSPNPTDVSIGRSLTNTKHVTKIMVKVISIRPTLLQIYLNIYIFGTLLSFFLGTSKYSARAEAQKLPHIRRAQNF
jgi:hypothetical protein